MAIDPRIALGVQQPAFNNPFAALSDYRREREEAENRKRLTDSRVAADQAAIAENQAQTEAIQQKLQREQAEAEALKAWDGTPEMLQKIVGPERGHVILKGAEALKEQQIKSESALKENIGRVIGGIKALPTEDLRQHWYETVVQDYAKRGWIKPDQLQPYSPETLDLYQQWAMSPSEQAAANKPIELNKDTTLVDPKTGNVIASGPASPVEVKTPTTFAGALLAAKDNPAELRRLLDLQKQQAGATRAPDSGTTDRAPFWVNRGGKMIRIKESEYQPGDLPASTREQGRSVTAGDASDMADFDTSLDELAAVRAAITPADSTGIVARIGAKIPYVTQITGWGSDAKKRQAVIDRVKQVIGKTLEGGVLRKEDEIKYEKILPNIGDPQDVALEKLNGLDVAIAKRKQRRIDALKDANYDVTKFETRTAPTAPKAGGITILKIEQVP